MRLYPGPGRESNVKLQSGSVSHIKIGGVRLGYVTHLVDHPTKSIVNITLPWLAWT